MCFDCEAMDLDGEVMSFMTVTIVFNIKVYGHKFMNTIEATKEVPTRDTIENKWKWRDLVMFYKTILQM